MTVLEASDRIGGRIHDENVLGTCVSRGAMFITGICNNPITTLAHQMGVALHMVNEDKCELMLERGVAVDTPTDVRVEQHFNAALDKLAVWRAHSAGDRSLASNITIIPSFGKFSCVKFLRNVLSKIWCVKFL